MSPTPEQLPPPHLTPGPLTSRRTFLSRAGGLGLTAAGAFALAACGSSGGGGTTSNSAAKPSPSATGVVVSKPVEGKTNVSWWSHDNPAFVAANKEMIKRFQAANSDINIVYEYFPYDVLIRKLQAAYRAKNVADMQQMFGTWVTEYAKNGLLDEVPASIGADKVKNEFWPAPVGAYQYNGKIYGMPHEYNLENGGMLYNPKLAAASNIKAPPTTWQEMITTAQKLTKRDSKGKVTQIGLAYTGVDDVTFLFLAMILQQGADYWDTDKVHVNFHTPEAKQAWADETALVTKYKVDNTTWYTGDPYEVFFRGRAAMAKQGPWVVPSGEAEFPKFKNFEYVPFPPYKGDHIEFAAESGWGEVVNAAADPKIKTAAWKFIDFISQAKNLRTWCSMTGTVPALKSLKNDPQLLKTAPYLKVSFDILQYGRWVGPVQDRDAFWTTMDDAFINVELKRKSAAEALADAEKEINAMIDQHTGP